MAIYIDRAEIKNKVVLAQGKVNNQTGIDEEKLDEKISSYYTEADEKYIEKFRLLGIDSVDVPNYASGNMSPTAKRYVLSYFYWRFFEDNFSNADTSIYQGGDNIYNDSEYWKNVFIDIDGIIDTEDITNDPANKDDNYIFDAPRGGFQ